MLHTFICIYFFYLKNWWARWCSVYSASRWDVENYSHTFWQALTCNCLFACLNEHVPRLKCKQENGWNKDQLISLNSPPGFKPVLTPLTLGGSSLISISLWEADTFLSVVCWMQTACCFGEGLCSFYLYLSYQPCRFTEMENQTEAWFKFRQN